MGKYYLYRHVLISKNQPFYIGIGKKRDKAISVEAEYSRAFQRNKRSSFWENVARKYNYKYSIEILYETDNKDEILKKEIEFVSLYGRRIDGSGILCNLTPGGESFSERTRFFIKRGKNNHRAKPIYQYDKDTGIFIRKFDCLKESMSIYGSLTLIKPISLSKGFLWSRVFLDQVPKYTPFDYSSFKRKVFQYSIDGERLGEFISVSQAASFLGSKSYIGDITRVCSGKRKTAGGFVWKYE